MTMAFPSGLLPAVPGLVITAGLAPADLGDLPTLDIDALDPGSPPIERARSREPGSPLPEPSRSGEPDGRVGSHLTPLIKGTPGVAAAVVVAARSLTDLRRAATLSALLPAAKQIVIAVGSAPPGQRPVAPRLPPDWHPLRELCVLHQDGGWAVRVVLGKALPAGALLAAVVRDLDGRPLARTIRVALAGAGCAHWLPGHPGAVLTTESGPIEEASGFLPADLALRVVDPDPVPWADQRVTAIDRPRGLGASWAELARPGATAEVDSLARALTDVDAVPPVDERSVNPTGFVYHPSLGTAELVQAGDSWTIRGGGADPVGVPATGAVTDVEVARLRELRAVEIRWGRHTGPLAAVRAVAGLAAAGVPLCAAEVPDWAGALGPELAAVLTGVATNDLDDDIAREEHSVRLRRAALGTHSTRARWRSLARRAGLPVPPPPRISVLLCTRRPEYVGFALDQIARQRGVELEAVVTLHGVPADRPEVREAVAAFPLPLTVVEAPDSASFGEALNLGAAAATGHYLAKWDDDDWYGPDWLADALLAVDYSGADLVGGLPQFVYLEEINVTVGRRGGESERWTRRISGSSLVLDRHLLHAAGGFPPLRRNVDTGLLRVVEAVGGRIYRTHGLSLMIRRRAAGHTWGQSVPTFLRTSERQWYGFRPGALVEADGRRSVDHAA